jgi:hypothetical protein
MGKTIESILYKGNVDKSLRVSYVFKLELEGKFASVSESADGSKITTYPSYMIILSSINLNTRFIIGSTKYFTFVTMLEKTIKLIQENLFVLFPNVGKEEFDMEDSALGRFQKEKALTSCDITMIPTLYTDGSGGCSPGINVSLNKKDSSITISLEDAIAINQMFKTFDPNIYGFNILSQLIRL